MRNLVESIAFFIRGSSWGGDKKVKKEGLLTHFDSVCYYLFVDVKDLGGRPIPDSLHLEDILLLLLADVVDLLHVAVGQLLHGLLTVLLLVLRYILGLLCVWLGVLER
jgi:hypothetical protein